MNSKSDEYDMVLQESKMEKILAIDLGTKKIGLAMGYSEIAEPYKVLEISGGQKNELIAIKQIVEVINKENIKVVLIGNPYIRKGLEKDLGQDFLATGEVKDLDRSEATLGFEQVSKDGKKISKEDEIITQDFGEIAKEDRIISNEYKKISKEDRKNSRRYYEFYDKIVKLIQKSGFKVYTNKNYSNINTNYNDAISHEKLDKNTFDIKVLMIDESYTSKDSMQDMIDYGISKNQRSKDDAFAACQLIYRYYELVGR